MRQFYKMHESNKNKTRKKCKNINTSNTQSLVQYRQKQYLPQWSRHSVARHKISAASAGDFIIVHFALIGSLGVAT